MTSQLSSTELSKLKVQDLKRELKSRDLPVSGNKSELLERLEQAVKAEEAEALLEEPTNDTEDDVTLAENTPVKPTTPAVTPNVEKVVNVSPAAKVAVVSPVKTAAVTPKQTDSASSVEEAAGEVDKAETTEQKKLTRAERFGIVSDDAVKAKRAERFGIVSEEDKKAQRAAKFGLSVENGTPDNSDNADKKSKRAARFGIVASETKSKTEETAEMTEEARQRLLKRKDRFGEVTSTVVNKVETDEKIKQRAARFGAITVGAVSTEDQAKKKKRMERFAAA